MYLDNPGTIIFLGAFALFLIVFIISSLSSAIRGTSEAKRLSAESKFFNMAMYKNYNEIVEILGTPQREEERTCSKTGKPIKVSTWKGGYYTWKRYSFDIVVTFDADNKFRSVSMYSMR